MPMDHSAVKPLLQRALDLMDTADKWEREAAFEAHVVGLQGEKRRLRWLSREARNVVDMLRHGAYDVLDKVRLTPKPGTVDVSGLTDCEATMNGIIDKLWVIYAEAHQLANDMVVAKFRSFAQWLYCYTDKLFCIIGTLQRNRCEYEKASYEYHHVSRYQVGMCNIHDDYEKKEAAQGYVDAHE